MSQAVAQFEPLGRVDELAAIDRFLHAPWPALLLLTGPAGIGKSTLWSDVVRRAGTLGARVIPGRLAQAERDLAFSALEIVFGPLLETEAAMMMAPHRRDLLSNVLRDGDAPVADLRAVGLALAELMSGTVHDGCSVLLAIDDVQWIDPASSAAIAYALRRVPQRSLAVAAAARTAPGVDPATEPYAPLLAAIDEVGQHLLPVTPLAVGVIGRLLNDRLELRLPRATLVKLHELSVGNPLTALEMGRALQAGQSLSSGHRQGDLIQRRLAGVAGEARQLLALIGATGTPEIGVAEALLGERYDRALAAALADGLVTLEAGKLVASHPLVASIAYEMLAPAARRRLHAGLAEAVGVPEAAAVHLALSRATPDNIVADRLDHAAQRAADRGATQRAVELQAMAIEFTPDDDRTASHRRRLRRARWLVAAGDLTAAATELDVLERTVDHAPELAEVLLVRCDLAAAADDRARARQAALAALAMAGSDARLQARCHAALAQSTGLGVDEEREHASAVLRLVTADDEPDAVAAAITTIVHARLAAGDGIDDSLVEQAIALDEKSTLRSIDRPISSLVSVWRTAGDLDLARTMQSAAIEESRRRGDEPAVAFQLTQQAATELRHGDVAAADRCLDEAEHLASFCGLELPAITPYRAMSAALAGRLDEADRLVEASRSIAAGADWLLPVIARPAGLVALQRGQPDDAVRHFTDVRQAARRMGITEPAWFATDADLVEALVAGRRLDTAGQVAEQLEAAADLGGLPWTRMAAARARLLVAAATGVTDLGEAVATAEATVERITSAYERGRTQLVVGSVLQRLGRRNDARLALTSAADAFVALGLAGFAETARRQSDRLGGRVAVGLRLTPSERQVAELAADGLTNREIGERLVLSVRTVESHLSSAYRKLGVRTRAGLGRNLRDQPRP